MTFSATCAPARHEQCQRAQPTTPDAPHAWSARRTRSPLSTWTAHLTSAKEPAPSVETTRYGPTYSVFPEVHTSADMMQPPDNVMRPRRLWVVPRRGGDGRWVGGCRGKERKQAGRARGCHAAAAKHERECDAAGRRPRAARHAGGRGAEAVARRARGRMRTAAPLTKAERASVTMLMRKTMRWQWRDEGQCRSQRC